MTAAALDSYSPRDASSHALDAWVRRFGDAEIPVLRSTADALETCRENEDDVDANLLGEMIAADPLMTLKVFAYEAAHRGRRVVTSAETVTAALVMMGITPFFRAFGPQPVLEDRLSVVDGALDGWARVLERSKRGAEYALAFAVHRADPQAAVIHAVALLHEFAEMLVWCHEPALAVRISSWLDSTPGLRSKSVQEDVLGVDIETLQRALVLAWRLPPLLDDVLGAALPAGHTSARTVALAARLARHTERGWDDPAIPDDVAAIAELLHLSPAATLEFVQRI